MEWFIAAKYLHKAAVWKVNRLAPLVAHLIVEAIDGGGSLLVFSELFQGTAVTDIAIAGQHFYALAIDIL